MICNALQIIRDAYYNRGVAQFGRALRSGRRGRGFESRRFDSLAGAPEHLRDQGSGVFRYAIMVYSDYKECHLQCYCV